MRKADMPDFDELDSEIEENRLPSFLTLASFLRETISTGEPIISDLLRVGRKLQIVGKSKVGKSYFALDLGLSVAHGVDLGSLKIPKARRVLYVNFELHPEAIQERLKNLSKRYSIENPAHENFAILNLRGCSADPKHIMEHIVEEALRHRSEVIIIDPIYLLIEGNENDSHVIKPLTTQIDWAIEQTNAALIYVHHDTKGKYSGERARVDRGSGSGIFGRFWDAQIAIDLHANSDELVALSFDSRENASLPPMSMKREGGCLVCSDLKAEIRTAESDKRNNLRFEDQAKARQVALAFIVDQNKNYLPPTTAAVRSHLVEQCRLSNRQAEQIVKGIGDGTVTDRKTIKHKIRGHQRIIFEVVDPISPLCDTAEKV